MRKEWKIGFILTTVILTVVLLRECVATSYLIPSSGMENVLYQGERILVNRWSYGLRLPFMKLWGYHRWAENDVAREDIIVFNNPANRKEKVIDQREVFISRCIGLPGDTLLMDTLFNISAAANSSPDQKFLYAYLKEKEAQLDSLLARLSISQEKPVGGDSIRNIRNFSRYEYYLLEQAMNDSCWISLLHPQEAVANLNPFIIPHQGSTLRVYPWNRALLCNTLLLHEGKKAAIVNDTLYVDGKPVEECHFTKDYHWVVSGSPISLSDSRLFGWVPKDHIIGKASYIWFSADKERIGKHVR